MLADLANSGINSTDARAMRVTPLNADETRALTKDAILDASYRIPYFKLDGTVDPAFFRLRRVALEAADEETKTEFKNDIRYWQAANSIPRVYLPPVLQGKLTWQDVAGDPNITIFITEGEKKAACACLNGFVCAGIGGVWSWQAKKKADAPMLPDLMMIKWEGRSVVLVFDSDSVTNRNVAEALKAFARALALAGARVTQIRLPLEAGKKTGLDDFITEEGTEAFNALYLAGKNLISAKSFGALESGIPAQS